MQYINYERIIAILGLCVWFIFPFGMFISIMRQDREALPAKSDKELKRIKEEEHIKIFGHKEMLYSEESDEFDIPVDEEFLEDSRKDDDFIHPHEGIGSTHGHHISH